MSSAVCMCRAVDLPHVCPLHAAALELYEALASTLEMLEYVHRENGRIHNLDTLRMRITGARAALAKARGER